MAKTAPPSPAPTEFQYDPEKHIVIAQKVYDRDAISEECRNAIGHINHADQQLAIMDANMRTFRVGRDGMVTQLIERLQQDGTPVVAVVPDPPAEGEAE